MIQKILHREFILTFFAQFALSSSSNLLVPTLPIYFLRSGATEVEIGVLIGILGVSSVVLRPIVGRTLLRIPERNFMFGGALLLAICSIGYLLVPPFWPLLIVRVLQGIGITFFYTASVTLIANISPESHRGQSISYFYLAFQISLVLGPSLGMLLINHFSFALLFAVCASLSLCSLFITFKLPARPVDTLKDQSMKGQSLFSRQALPPAVMAFMTSCVYGAIIAFFPLYALDHGVANPGLFFSAFAITIILGRTLGGRILDLHSRERVIFPCLSIYILAMSILPFCKTLPMFIVVAVIWGIGHTFLYPALSVYTLDLAGSSPGPALGIFTAADDFGTGFGAVIMGVVLRFTSYPIMFLCLAFVGAINLCYFYCIVKKRRAFH
ncbi:MAG: MFS transporter [Thermodesulfobacteriota bacterium]